MLGIKFGRLSIRKTRNPNLSEIQNPGKDQQKRAKRDELEIQTPSKDPQSRVLPPQHNSSQPLTNVAARCACDATFDKIPAYYEHLSSCGLSELECPGAPLHRNMTGSFSAKKTRQAKDPPKIKGLPSKYNLANLDEFSYDGLDIENRTIRAIYVLRTDDDSEPVRCIMRLVNLDDEYCCLSYVWGSESDRQIIELNSKRFLVGSNVVDFLRLARRPNSGFEFPVWIDAICLKSAKQTRAQSSSTSDGHHIPGGKVTFARRIESAAASAEHNRRTQAYEAERERKLRSNAKHLACHAITEPEQAWLTEDEIIDVAFGKMNMSAADIEELCRLCMDSYFTRLWVIQEIRLTRAANIACEEININWRVLCHLFDYVSRGLGGATTLPITTLHQAQNACIRIQLLPLLATESARHKDPERRYIEWGGRHHRTNLWDWLRKSESKQCTVPHDRVYSLLGLIQYGETFHIDYREKLDLLCVRTLDYVLSTTPFSPSIPDLLGVFDQNGKSLLEHALWKNGPEYVVQQDVSEHGSTSIQIWQPRLSQALSPAIPTEHCYEVYNQRFLSLISAPEGYEFVNADDDPSIWWRNTPRSSVMHIPYQSWGSRIVGVRFTQVENNTCARLLLAPETPHDRRPEFLMNRHIVCISFPDQLGRPPVLDILQS